MSTTRSTSTTRIGEQRICIHTDKEAEESRLSSSDDEYLDSVLLPVSRNLHGAACHHDACRDSFYQLPSARTLQKEHPRPWTAPRKRSQTHSCDAKEDCCRIKVRAPRYTLQEHFPSAYKEPWPEHGRAVRPATAGREHELPTWYLTPTHTRSCLCRGTRVVPLTSLSLCHSPSLIIHTHKHTAVYTCFLPCSVRVDLNLCIFF